MRKLIIVLAFLGLSVAPAPTQNSGRLYTNPVLPSGELLDRLNLTLAWRVRVPMDGRRDGLDSLQMLPAAGKEQLLIQTRSGLLQLLDAETGDLRWRTHVGLPFEESQPPGSSRDNIFVTRRDVLFILNRANGKQRLYTIDKDGHTTYGLSLNVAASAAPVADDEAVYLALGTRVTAFEVPNFAAVEKAKAAGQKEKGEETKSEAAQPESSLQLEYRFNTFTEGIPVPFIPFTPVLTPDAVAVIGSEGTFLVLNKFQGAEFSRYTLRTGVSVGMGQHGAMAYVGADDYTVYAMNTANAKMRWRFLAGGPITRPPQAIDNDVFVGSRAGLFRVDRDTGEQKWHNRGGDRFLAASQKFVYATDRQGRLLVLDHERGTQLAVYDLSDFNVPLSNEATDRLYLAAHDGTLICLRPRDKVKPYRPRALLKKPAPETKEPKKEEPKVEEPKKEEPKQEEPKKEEPKKEEMKKEDMEEKKEEMKKEEKKEEMKKEEKKEDAAPKKDDAGTAQVRATGAWADQARPLPAGPRRDKPDKRSAVVAWWLADGGGPPSAGRRWATPHRNFW